MRKSKPQDPPRPPRKPDGHASVEKPAEPREKPVIFTDFASI